MPYVHDKKTPRNRPAQKREKNWVLVSLKRLEGFTGIAEKSHLRGENTILGFDSFVIKKLSINCTASS